MRQRFQASVARCQAHATCNLEKFVPLGEDGAKMGPHVSKHSGHSDKMGGVLLLPFQATPVP